MDKIDRIEYTQHNVAFPTLKLTPTWHEDELQITAPAKGGGVYGEFTINFMRFSSNHPAVQITFFGDGSKLFYDERVQKVMAAWGNQDNPDDATIYDFMHWFDMVGAKPSRYHRNGIREAKSMPTRENYNYPYAADDARA